MDWPGFRQGSLADRPCASASARSIGDPHHPGLRPGRRRDQNGPVPTPNAPGFLITSNSSARLSPPSLPLHPLAGWLPIRPTDCASAKARTCATCTPSLAMCCAKNAPAGMCRCCAVTWLCLVRCTSSWILPWNWSTAASASASGVELYNCSGDFSIVPRAAYHPPRILEGCHPDRCHLACLSPVDESPAL